MNSSQARSIERRRPADFGVALTLLAARLWSRRRRPIGAAQENFKKSTSKRT